MISVLSKPADQITVRDIESLIETAVPEGEQIEFKEALPAKGQSQDPWMSGEDRIGDRAKDAILEEALAFANAYGGALLLGIRESSQKPPVAKEISPIPRCADLADRLKLIFRDRVEPQLPQIEIFSIPLENQAGVLIIRVGRSRLAPHRDRKTLACPVRRADRCEKLSMREIQDMTLNVSRGLERLDKRLSDRAHRFQKEFECLLTPQHAYGMRITAAPIGEEIWLDRVFRLRSIVNELDEKWHQVYWQGTDPRQVLDQTEQLQPDRWRPMLRAARADFQSDTLSAHHHTNSFREIHCDGLLEWGFVSPRLIFPEEAEKLGFPEKGELFFEPDWPIVLFANLAVWADKVRYRAHVPTAEYAIEVEIRVVGGPVTVKRYLGNRVIGRLQPGSNLFPRYSLGAPEELLQLLDRFRRDFWNFLGQSGEEKTTLAIENWPREELE